MAILVPRSETPLQYAAEVLREPGTRNVGAATAVPKMIREALPIPGISTAVTGPRLTTRTGTGQATNINPLAGAALGALAANIISQRTKQPPSTTRPPTPQPPGGSTTPPPGPSTPPPTPTPPPGPSRPPTSPPPSSGGRPTTPVPGTPGYTGPVGIFTQNPDGSITQTMDDGSTITTDQSGNILYTEEAPTDAWSYDPDSGTFYNSDTGVYYDPETGTEQFGGYSQDFLDSISGESLDTLYEDILDSGDNLIEFTDPGYYSNFVSPTEVYPVPDWQQYVVPIDWGTGIDYGNLDYGLFFGKEGGMATPLMRKGGVVKMSDGGNAGYSYDLYDYSGPTVTTGDQGYSYDLYDYGTGIPVSTDAEAQPGGFYGTSTGSAGTVYTNPLTGEVFRDGVKIYDPNVGTTGASIRFRTTPAEVANTASGALSTIQNFIQQNPGTSGALAGALLSQVLSQSTGGGRENLGVDMTKYGAISPRTTTFGVGAPRFLTYEQYGSQQAMPEMYGAELYRNLNAPGFNPVNPVLAAPATRAPLPKPGMRAGGLAHMADGGPTYYTYGRPVSPADNLMAEGGQPMMGGGVPMVQGRVDYREGSAVNGPGDGQSDDIPAMLADGEYVIDAETVAMLGNGSNKAGAEKLDEFRMNIRKHKRETPLDKIPPPSKSPLSYLKGK